MEERVKYHLNQYFRKILKKEENTGNYHEIILQKPF